MPLQCMIPHPSVMVSFCFDGAQNHAICAHARLHKNGTPAPMPLDTTMQQITGTWKLNSE